MPYWLNLIIQNIKTYKKERIFRSSHLSLCFSHCLRLSIECIHSLCLHLPLKSSLILWQSPSTSMFELLPCSGIYVFIEFAFLTCKKTSVAKADTLWKYHLPAFIPEKKTGSVPSGIRGPNPEDQPHFFSQNSHSWDVLCSGYRRLEEEGGEGAWLQWSIRYWAAMEPWRRQKSGTVRNFHSTFPRPLA